MTQNTTPPTPELDKMLKVKDESHIIGQFLEWLFDEKEYTICEWDEDECMPVRLSIERMLADYFDIDLKKCEQERQAILDSLRK